MVLAGCCLVSIGIQSFVIAPSSIAPLLVEQFTLSRAETGNIVSAVMLGMILVQLPSGYLLDRFDNRWLVIPGVALYIAIVVAIQFVDSYGQFLQLRVLGGVAGGIVFTAGANVVAQVFVDGKQSFATGLYLASPPMGWAIAHTTSPAIGTAYGPLSVFLLHGLVAFVGVALFWIAADRPIRSEGSPTVGEFVRAFGNRSILLVSVSAFSLYSLYLFLNSWLPTYGTEVLSLPLATAGIATAIVPIVGIFARPAGGWLSGFLGGRHRFVLLTGLSLGFVFLVATPFASYLPLFLLLITGAAFSIQLGTGVYYVLTRELATPGTEGTSLAVLTSISWTGSLTAPIAGGWLVATYSWMAAFAVFGVVALVGIIALLPLPAK